MPPRASPCTSSARARRAPSPRRRRLLAREPVREPAEPVRAAQQLHAPAARWSSTASTATPCRARARRPGTSTQSPAILRAADARPRASPWCGWPAAASSASAARAHRRPRANIPKVSLPALFHSVSLDTRPSPSPIGMTFPLMSGSVSMAERRIDTSSSENMLFTITNPSAWYCDRSSGVSSRVAAHSLEWRSPGRPLASVTSATVSRETSTEAGVRLREVCRSRPSSSGFEIFGSELAAHSRRARKPYVQRSRSRSRSQAPFRR